MEKPLPTVRIFAPEQWGQLERFAKFYGGTFNFSNTSRKAISGAINHFRKAVVLKELAIKLKPNLQLDRDELTARGYSSAEYSNELSAVIEGIFTELYSSIDCTRKVIFEIHEKCRGLPDSTRKLFQRVQEYKIGNDFPNELKQAIQQASWYDELRKIRDELTHSDIGSCHLNVDTGKVSYMHSGLGGADRALVIDDVFEKIEALFYGVNSFLGSTFLFLNTRLNSTPISQFCGIFSGRIYSRLVSPADAIDINSGTCDSYHWFELEENPTCPFTNSCGAYLRAKPFSTTSDSIRTNT